MANTYNAGTNAKIQTLITAITTALNNEVELDLSQSVGFKLELRVTSDGQSVVVTATQDNGANNPFGPIIQGTRRQRASRKVIPFTSLP